MKSFCVTSYSRVGSDTKGRDGTSLESITRTQIRSKHETDRRQENRIHRHPRDVDVLGNHLMIVFSTCNC